MLLAGEALVADTAMLGQG